uniref:Uncharacterized protein n=1 Tax=Acrobeloides nanus TaxID=290746 RepID=A0A914DDZ0_9BILA
MIASPTTRSILAQNSELDATYMSSSQISSGVFPFSATTGWFSVLSILGIAVAAGNEKTEKCYSCSSAHLNARWPKTEDNRLMYFNSFPIYSNETCDSLRYMIPVVSCPDSVCVKVVIEEPPPSRAVCSQEPVIIRDCWSRIIQPQSSFDLKPEGLKPVRLAGGENFEDAVGLIYTCEGYLCNKSSMSTSNFLPIFVCFILFSTIFLT